MVDAVRKAAKYPGDGFEIVVLAKASVVDGGPSTPLDPDQYEWTLTYEKNFDPYPNVTFRKATVAEVSAVAGANNVAAAEYGGLHMTALGTDARPATETPSTTRLALRRRHKVTKVWKLHWVFDLEILPTDVVIP
jgi:hypothetical protein